MNNETHRPEVQIRPHSYQPSKVELEEEIQIDATPEDLAVALLRPKRVIEDTNATLK